MAERLLADRTEFALPPNQWQQFDDLLDRSPRDNPGLEKLFSQPSVFSGPGGGAQMLPGGIT